MLQKMYQELQFVIILLLLHVMDCVNLFWREAEERPNVNANLYKSY